MSTPKQQTLYDVWKPPETRPLRGTQDDRMQREGRYAELFRLQAAALPDGWRDGWGGGMQ